MINWNVPKMDDKVICPNCSRTNFDCDIFRNKCWGCGSKLGVNGK